MHQPAFEHRINEARTSAKNLHAENIDADRGTFAEICVKDSGGQKDVSHAPRDFLSFGMPRGPKRRSRQRPGE